MKGTWDGKPSKILRPWLSAFRQNATKRYANSKQALEPKCSIERLQGEVYRLRQLRPPLHLQLIIYSTTLSTY